MKFEKILPEIRKGKEARRKSKPDNIISGFDVCHDYGTIEDLFADDWELVPEPKKYSVKVYLWSDGKATLDCKRCGCAQERVIEWEAPE